MTGNPTVVRQLRGVARIAAELGVSVREAPGWTTRGRSSDLVVDALLHHHIGATVDIDDLLVRGRPGIPGPLANESLHRDGVLVLLASGRANHAGVGILPSDRSLGLEVTGPIPLSNTGPDAFPQYDEYVNVSAAHVIYYGWPPDLAHIPGHKETARPRGRKVNPAFDMDVFRRRVADVVTRYRTTTQEDHFLAGLTAAEATLLAKALATELDPLITSRFVFIGCREHGDWGVFLSDGDGRLFHVQNPGQFGQLAGEGLGEGTVIQLPESAPIWRTAEVNTELPVPSAADIRRLHEVYGGIT